MSTQLDQIVAKCNTILAQCLIAANDAAVAAASIGAAGLAPLQSPLFTGNPRAPTATIGDSSDSIATTAFLARLIGQPSGLATLDNSGVVPLSQLPFTGLTYDGVWDASSNTPALASGSGVNGHFRLVTVAGTTNLDGITSWAVGDWALFSSVWTQVPYTAPPVSNLPLTALEGINSTTVVANVSGMASSPAAIPISSLTPYINVAAAGSVGLLPALPVSGGTGVFLRGDGTYVAPPGADLSAYATLFAPAFTGTATVNTQDRNVLSSAIASTQWVVNQIARAGELAQLKVNGTAASGTSTYMAAIDHIHPTDTSRAAAENPQMSGSGGVYNGTMTIGPRLTVNGTAVVSNNMTVGGTLTPASLGGTVVAEGNLSFTDVATNDASTAKHGLLRKLDNVATHFLDGQGNWSTPAAGLTGATNGLTTSGANAVMNTNNSVGVGAYAIILPDSPVSNGATFTAGSYAGIGPSGRATGGSITGTWRNVSGFSLNDVSSAAGLCIRVS